MRILAVDPGSKRLGIAISDPSGTISRPLLVINHKSREEDAIRIAEIADKNMIGLIIIGLPLDEEGNPGPQARKAIRLAGVLKSHTVIPIELWDESGSTIEAHQVRTAMKVKKRKNKGHLDDLAAAIILQSYIDARIQPGSKFVNNSE